MTLSRSLRSCVAIYIVDRAPGELVFLCVQVRGLSVFMVAAFLLNSFSSANLTWMRLDCINGSDPRATSKGHSQPASNITEIVV